MKKINTLAIIQVESDISLLHTHIACMSYKEKNPQVSLTLVTFEKIAKLIETQLTHTFSEIIYVDNEVSSATLPSDSFILQNLKRTQFDLAINFSQSLFSSELLTYISAKEKKGCSLNKDREVSVYDTFGQFLMMASANSELIAIHPLDIYKRMLDLDSLEITSPQKSNKTIVVEVFFQNRALTNIFWSNLIYTLAKDAQNYQIILIGDSESIHLAKELCQMPVIKAYSDRIKNNVGKNKTSDNLILLREASLFVGTNNFNLALTSYWQTPSVSLANIYQMPKAYNKNLYVINSSKFSEVTALCEALLSASPTYVPRELGFFIDKPEIGLLHSLESNRQLETQGCLKSLYQAIWSFYLFDVEYSPSVMKIAQSSLKELETTIFAIDQLTDLYKFGIEFSKRIIKDFDQMPNSYSSLQDSVVRIKEIDELADALLNKFPELRPINDLVQIMKKNAQGNDLKDVANVTLFQFQNGIFLLSALDELIKQICNNQTITKKNFEA